MGLATQHKKLEKNINLLAIGMLPPNAKITAEVCSGRTLPKLK
tara:strand:- start:398 stop:526 length:129 start_codon:yes stop_codon:yes gene_type:complete